MAEHAATLVAETDVIAIDAGTTAYDVATQLPAGFAGTVVTNSIPVVQHMLEQPRARLIGLGVQLVEAGERGQVRASEGSVRHVEVFPVGSVRTPIIGRTSTPTRPPTRQPRYTLNCEEPVSLFVNVQVITKRMC